MRIYAPTRAIMAAILSVAGTANIARADVKDYEFQLVEPSMKTGPATVIAVRLVNKATGKPITGAVIFATRLDMAPDSMAGMTTKIAPVPGGEPGVYRFEANVTMAGRWQLSLGAKVQGEIGTVESKLVIAAQQ